MLLTRVANFKIKKKFFAGFASNKYLTEEKNEVNLGLELASQHQTVELRQDDGRWDLCQDMKMREEVGGFKEMVQT